MSSTGKKVVDLFKALKESLKPSDGQDKMTTKKPITATYPNRVQVPKTCECIYDSAGNIVFHDGRLGAWETPLSKQFEPGVLYEMVVTFLSVGTGMTTSLCPECSEVHEVPERDGYEGTCGECGCDFITDIDAGEDGEACFRLIRVIPCTL